MIENQETINLRHQFAINNACAVEDALSASVSGNPLRQVYHVMPKINWMNDPCGMVYFHNAYHLFYQYDPYHITPRGMYFGHVRSTDLAHWEYLPIALAPSEPNEMYPYDRQGKNFGIFTGSAAVDGDRLVMAYCGSSYDEEDELKQTICLAFSTDGVHFEKYPGNPVIAMQPEDGSRDFRDPKLWKHDGRWYMLMGSSKDGLGEVLLYTSENLTDWTYVGISARSDGRFGRMWECPDFFELDGRDVLMFSPIGMKGVDTCYMTGHMDYQTGKFAMETWGKIDLGYEFYAPQTLLAPDGRRIMMGWCNMWHHDGRSTFTTYGPTAQMGWCGGMSLPREMHLDAQGRLLLTPAAESALLRLSPSCVYRYDLSGAAQEIPFRFSKAAEFVLDLDAVAMNAGRAGIRVRGNAEADRYTEIGFDAESGTLYIDRTRSDGIYNDFQRFTVEKKEHIRLRLYTDSTSIELYADEGRVCASDNIYPDPEWTRVSLFAANTAAHMTLEAWNLKG